MNAESHSFQRPSMPSVVGRRLNVKTSLPFQKAKAKSNTRNSIRDDGSNDDDDDDNNNNNNNSVNNSVNNSNDNVTGTTAKDFISSSSSSQEESNDDDGVKQRQQQQQKKNPREEGMKIDTTAPIPNGGKGSIGNNNNFNALLSKFGGGGTKIRTPKFGNKLQQRKGARSDDDDNNNNHRHHMASSSSSSEEEEEKEEPDAFTMLPIIGSGDDRDDHRKPPSPSAAAVAAPQSSISDFDNNPSTSSSHPSKNDNIHGGGDTNEEFPILDPRPKNITNHDETIVDTAAAAAAADPAPPKIYPKSPHVGKGGLKMPIPFLKSRTTQPKQQQQQQQQQQSDMPRPPSRSNSAINDDNNEITARQHSSSSTPVPGTDKHKTTKSNNSGGGTKQRNPFAKQQPQQKQQPKSNVRQRPMSSFLATSSSSSRPSRHNRSRSASSSFAKHRYAGGDVDGNAASDYDYIGNNNNNNGNNGNNGNNRHPHSNSGTTNHAPQSSHRQRNHRNNDNSNNHNNHNNHNGNNNMVQPKSQQRLVLERVAARYFLNRGNDENGAGRRYVGITDYGDVGGGGMDCHLGNIDENSNDNYASNNVPGLLLPGSSEDGGSSSGATPPPLGWNERRRAARNTEDRDALIAFLGGGSGAKDRRRDEGDVIARDHHASGSDNNGTENSNNDNNDNNDNGTGGRRKSAAEQARDIQRETDIDAILEMASDHLSLGKNDLALQAYRRAMKCAFADVLSVKRKLVEVKRKRPPPPSSDADRPDDGDEEELTKSQEMQFELSLLQVASRVADIHNNMGVVHEMNRHYRKARDSYVDALEVYHNTCRRFEEEGDVDVDRTKRNVERMDSACASEEERRALHDEAERVAGRVEEEGGRVPTFARRRALLEEAVSTLHKALELENSTIGASHPVAASTLVRIGKLRYEMREYAAAAWDIRRAVGILRNALGGNHPQVGKTTLLLASIYERHGESIVTPVAAAVSSSTTTSRGGGGGGSGATSGAADGNGRDDAELELYVDALEPLKATLGEVHPEVGFLYVKIGYLYGKKGDLNLSLLAYKAALKAYGEPSSDASPVLGGGGAIHPEVVSIWVQVTRHSTTLKSWRDVLVAGRRALFLLRRSKNTLFQGARLTTSATNSSNNYEGARSVSPPQQHPRVPAASRSSKKSHIQITCQTYYDTLFATLQCLGQAHTSLSDYPRARDACSESLRLAWEMALSSSHNLCSSISGPASSSKEKKEQVPLLTDLILRIIRALKRLGKAHLLERHYTPALECFLPSLELLRSSAETESTLDCASVLGSLGFLYLKLQRYNESSNFLRECLRLYPRNGVDENDRETRKVQAWLEMAESREDEICAAPPSFLEIPTIVFNDENGDSIGG